MKKSANILSYVFCICCSFSLHAQGNLKVSNYTLRRFTPSTGFNSTQTRGITQDSLGYIWIATTFGLNRFDGYNFKTYELDPDNKLRTRFKLGIWYLLIDRKGSVWAVSDVLSRFDTTTDALVHFTPDIELEKVFRFTFDRDEHTVWMGTNKDGLYSFNSETGRTTRHLTTHSDSLTNAKRNSIWGISDRGASLLVATRQGLWNVDKATGRYSRPQCDPKDSSFLYNTSIWHIIDWPKFDPNDTWLVLQDGLIKINEDLSIIQRLDYPAGFQTIDYERDASGVFWLKSLENKLFRFDPLSGRFNLIEIRSSDESFSLERDLFIDRDGTIWSGSEASGAYQTIPQAMSFYNFNFPSRVMWTVSSLFQSNGRDKLILATTIRDKPCELWTAFPILSRNLDSVALQRLEMKVPLEGPILSTAVGKERLWLVSWNSGITGMAINQSGLIESANRFTLPSDPSNPNTISNEANGFAYVDDDENLWIVSRGNGLSKIISSKKYGSSGALERYVHSDVDTNSLSQNFGVKIYPADEKSLWVLTWSGLDLFHEGTFKHVLKGKESPRTILQSSSGAIYIGTTGALYKATKNGSGYNIEEIAQLNGYYLENILEDQQERLWITAPLSDRLLCYDAKKNILLEFDEKDGFPTGVTDMSKTSEGLMVVTSIHGFTVFDPSTFEIEGSGFTPAFSGLLVNNKPVKAGIKNAQDEFSIERDISQLNELVLDHNHNNFTLEFSSMEMTAPNKNLYRYMLVGFDKDWIERDSKNRTASYTNLDPGIYTFKVKASNHFGVWNDKTRTLVVHIVPPPWKTWWAYSIYGLILVGLFLSWRRYDIKRVKLKHRAEHLSELDNLKTRFFTNISHEFRTPITLIQGPLKELHDKAVNKEERSTFGIMLRNAQRLSKLINQLLDLSKLEAGKMTLHASNVELVQFLREIAASYESLAANKNIKYFFYPEVPELMVYIDVEKMEKVVHNLLSNAFKFTKENGEVIMYLKADGRHYNITVKDTGIGIPSDQLDKIFDRFHQVDSSQTRSYEGSGLGMALAKELVELHHGTIKVESIEGKGTTFTVALRLGKEHLNVNEIIDGEQPKAGSSIAETIMSPVEIGETKPFMSPDNGDVVKKVESSEQPILLIVEDNADMRHYIHKTFSGNYQIIEAVNGKDGLDKAQEIIPDLIISDVMMPEMDGYKFCEQVRSNEKTSHIPVILLTAKADTQSKITGLETGADDYLSKPFDADEIKLIVRNRIEQRRKIRERFSREITLEPKQISITSFDEKFLKKVMTIIEGHMSDENFSIDELSREAGYSNMHFYRKIKALAGETPSQFLRTIRLKRAAELLKAKSDNVTQIAYSVGFSSLSYFNKCFKEQFGVTPGQFAEANKKDVKL